MSRRIFAGVTWEVAVRRRARASVAACALAALGLVLGAMPASAQFGQFRYINSVVPVGGTIPECADTAADVGNGGATGYTYATYSWGGTGNNWSIRNVNFLRVRTQLGNTGVMATQSAYFYNIVPLDRVQGPCCPPAWWGLTHGRSQSGYYGNFGAGNIYNFGHLAGTALTSASARGPHLR